MSELARRLVIAVAVLALLGLAVWKLVGVDSNAGTNSNQSSGTDPSSGSHSTTETPANSVTNREPSTNHGPSPGTPTNGPIEVSSPLDGDGGLVRTNTPRLTPEQALRALQQIADASRRLMPPGFSALYLGMPLAEFNRVRPQARGETDQPQPVGTQLWSENDPSGVRVMYIFGRGILSKVQFLSQLQSEREFAPHLLSLVERYGTPTGIWDCPETADASPMRRFTWRNEGASVMEAVLVHSSAIAVTLIVAATEDVGVALTRASCARVTDPSQLDHFPVAQTLRGERTSTLREIPHDR